MKKAVIALCLAAIAAVSLLSISPATTSPAPTIVMASSLKWTPVKGMSGLEVAVLWGDPTKTGSQFAERYKAVDGFKVAPHWHPTDEQVTVLSGTLLVGLGDKMDPTKMSALPAGSYAVVSAKVHHYASVKGETVFQINGIGPDKFNMLK